MSVKAEDGVMNDVRVQKFHWLWRSLQLSPDVFEAPEKTWLRRVRVGDTGKVGGKRVDEMYAAHGGPEAIPKLTVDAPIIQWHRFRESPRQRAMARAAARKKVAK